MGVGGGRGGTREHRGNGTTGREPGKGPGSAVVQMFWEVLLEVPCLRCIPHFGYILLRVSIRASRSWWNVANPQGKGPAAQDAATIRVSATRWERSSQMKHISGDALPFPSLRPWHSDALDRAASTQLALCEHTGKASAKVGLCILGNRRVSHVDAHQGLMELRGVDRADLCSREGMRGVKQWLVQDVQGSGRGVGRARVGLHVHGSRPSCRRPRWWCSSPGT